MFLRNHGASGRFTFDVIYSCLQKSLRRGDDKLAIEMGYEFAEYPNALKKRLIQNCTEDCPDLDLIREIYETKPELRSLMPYIPVICRHTKTRDGIYGMRIASEMDYVMEPPDLEKDDLMTMMRKCYTYVCRGAELEFIDCFQKKFNSVKLKYVYNFIGKHITFLYMLCVWNCLKWMHEDYYVGHFEFDENKKWDMNLKLPEYVYDKHTREAPKEHRTYKFFISNCVLYPRHDEKESEIEKEGKRIYLESNRGVMSNVHPIIEGCEIIDGKKVKMLQTQLVTASYKPRVFYCSIDEGKRYDYILKGPFASKDEMDPQLLSDEIKNELLTNPVYDSRIVSVDKMIYIMSLNLVPINPLETKKVSSKIEDDVYIHCGEKFLFAWNQLDKLSEGEERQLLEALAYRKIVGTNDTCPRNIIHYKDKIYTIDDPVLLTETPYLFKVQMGEKTKFKLEKMIERNFKWIKETLKKWDNIVYYSDVIPDEVKVFMRLRIVELMDKQNWVV